MIFAFYETQARKGIKHNEKLVAIVEKSQKLASSRAAPWGRGGTGAVCAPLVAAMDARARQLLGHREEMKDAVGVYYLPWIQSILNPSLEGSLHYTLKKSFDRQAMIGLH
jgi:hypothetical protein